MKILYITKYNTFKDVYSNIEFIIKTYGSRFNISYKKNIYPIKYFYKKNTNNEKINYLEYYEKKRKTLLKPFLLQFYSQVDELNKNNCYIANIHKINDISGSNMMDFILYFLKKIDVYKCFIFDDTKVYCDNTPMDLSLQKLLFKNQSFYQRFGFKYFISNREDPYKYKKISNKSIANNLQKKIKIFKNINVNELITLYIKSFNLLSNIVKNNDYKYLEIGIYDDNFNEIIYTNKDNQKEVSYLIECYLKLLPILFENKNKKLYNVLNNYFNNECKKYILLVNELFYNKIYIIIYKNKKIIFSLRKLMDIIIYIRNLNLYKIM